MQSVCVGARRSLSNSCKWPFCFADVNVYGINCHSRVSTHLFVHLSAHLCHHHPSLFYSRLKTYLFNKSFPSSTPGLPWWSWDWTRLIMLLGWSRPTLLNKPCLSLTTTTLRPSCHFGLHHLPLAWHCRHCSINWHLPIWLSQSNPWGGQLTIKLRMHDLTARQLHTQFITWLPHWPADGNVQWANGN